MTPITLETSHIQELIKNRGTKARLSPQAFIKKYELDKKIPPTMDITQEIDTLVYGK